MLFIRGTSDGYVPPAMVFPLYNANPKVPAHNCIAQRFNRIRITLGCAYAKSFNDYPANAAVR